MSETQNAVPITVAPKFLKRLIRREARKEAFDNLLANPALRLLTRSQIRALARTQVDRMFAEQRRLQREEGEAPAESPSTEGPSGNVVAEAVAAAKQIVAHEAVAQFTEVANG